MANLFKPFGKLLPIFETYVLANNNFWGKLFSSLDSSTVLDKRFKVTSAPFFIPEINLLSSELDNFTCKVL